MKPSTVNSWFDAAVEELACVASAIDPSVIKPNALSKIRVVPWGQVQSTHGQFVLDDLAIDKTINAFEAHGVDLPIDYEHQTMGGEFSSPNGQAPAAGWIKRLYHTAPDAGQNQAGLWAEVEWTEAAKQRLAAKEYRYLSPVVLMRKSDRRVIGLHSVGLTNKPAIVGMTPLVNKDNSASEHLDGPGDGASNSSDTEVTMQKELVSVLALKADASEMDIVVAVKSAAEKAKKADETQQQLVKVCSAIGVDSTLESDAINEALVALKQKADKADELAEQLANKEADDLIRQAKADGKLVEAQEDWARTLILSDRKSFDQWLAGAPVVRPQGKTESPEGSEGGSNRTTIINKAAREYAGHGESITQVTSCKAFVNDALREAKQPVLSEDEVKTLAIA